MQFYGNPYGSKSNQANNQYFITINAADNILLRDLTFKNIGNITNSYSVINIVEGFTSIASDTRDPNHKRYYINLTFESGKLHGSYAPININTGDGHYFKDITIKNIGAYPYYISITGLSTHANKNPGSRNIVFAGKLDLPAGKKKYVSGNIPVPVFLFLMSTNI